MKRETADRRFIWLLLLVAFGWAWAFWVPLALHENQLIGLPETVYRRFADSSPAAWGRLIGALMMALLQGGMAGHRALFASLTLARFSPRWYLAALFLIPAKVTTTCAAPTMAGVTAGPSEALQNLAGIPIAFV